MEKRILLIIAGVLAAVLVGTAATVAYFGIALPFNLECETKIVQSLVSPAGEYRAIAFQKHCGALDDGAKSKGLAIVPARGDYAIPRETILISPTRDYFQFAWSGSAELEISHHFNNYAFPKVFRGVTISEKWE